jgi:transposase
MHENCTRFVRELTQEEVIEIERLCRSRNRDIRDRAMVIKLSSQMISVPEITKQLKRARSYVLRWIDRFNSEGLGGLNPRPKSGRPREYTSEYDEKIKALIYERPEDLGLHFNTWTVRKLSEYMTEQGFQISYRSVHRHLKEAKITLKKAQKWMDSKDQKFRDKKNVLMN